VDRETLIRRVRETTASLQLDARFAEAGRKNWFILFGKELPG
jgi:hypothetical protein